MQRQSFIFKSREDGNPALSVSLPIEQVQKLLGHQQIDTIHAQGIDIVIYTTDFENEFISLTDIAKYKSDDPTAVIQN